jgi:NDP-sugar pyrophosphorylase family protein
LGTAGPIKLAEKYLLNRKATDPDFFLVLNSDIVSDFQFKDMI